jgi:predicted lipoprotein with Yx(FWY)xxD motif
MTQSRSITFLAGAALIALTALAIAGCGGGGATASTSPAKTGATVGTADTDLGKVLVDSKGRTLYLFKRDSGTKSACFGACADAWPPLRATGKPTVGGGASASMVSTTKRSDGAAQVTYNRHPLYLFEGDHKPGDTSGQGSTAFGGGWYALSPAGNEVSAQPPTSAGGGY